MTRRRTGGTHDWRQLLSSAMKRNRLSRGVTRARGLLLWPEVVGPDLARLTRARSQQGRVLFVETQDSVLANFLTLQREVFLQRLQERLGDDSIQEVRFAVGTWASPAQPRPSEPLPPPDRARAEALVERVPDSIRDSALRAAEAVTRAKLWRERQGWPRCPLCGTSSRKVPCLPCQTLLRDPAVSAAARVLTREPEALARLGGNLTEPGVEAARHLALGQLAEQLEVLAVECARAGGVSEYRSFLQAQAEVWLALAHRKPRAQLQRQDWNELPERPRQVLSAGR